MNTAMTLILIYLVTSDQPIQTKITNKITVGGLICKEL